ncbi:helix-turn-helix transcriptional regulator [Opitutus terrae]|uniref:Transcriptional regulator, AraC family n=1 Tax=Opitutus terrae (strain DSM 11246 / JCM 15787 / PB90-1) TaxID=452637 RepID=B1ZRE9_OPITP|nr:AraC family transcriptional regulator [Opitutus terrae]ACB74636.1 transcriptional regulator, AraC family [Opitutus terrae PB90-1]
MLRYFAQGPIRWKSSMHCNTRTNWEFYAVVAGRCGLRFSDWERATFHERRLWVFAPECSHAWANYHDESYTRLALHFSSVPYPLDEIARQNGGWLAKDLPDVEIKRVAAIANDLEPAFRQPNTLSQLVFQRRLIDLALLLLKDSPMATPTLALTDLAHFKTERAVAWYLEHLMHNPTVKQVADAIHVSPSHLRRLFWQSRRSGPKSVFCRLRLDKAKELMGRTSLTLEDVARHCGYASASHLCRDCRHVHHFSPTTWRKKLVDRFIRPLPPGVTPVREYSVRPEERTMPA